MTEKEWGVYKCGKSALRRTNVAMWDEGGGAVGGRGQRAGGGCGDGVGGGRVRVCGGKLRNNIR